MTQQDLDELKRLDAEAKQPPWTVQGGYVFPGDPDVIDKEAVWIFGMQDCGHPPTAALIVAARNALPRLLKEREMLLKACKNLAVPGPDGNPIPLRIAGVTQAIKYAEESHE